VRPPYGALDRRVRKIAGRPLILWSVDTEDWRYRRTDRLIKYVRKHRRNGAVILMHDIHPSTVRAAEPIIRELKANGYQLVTVSELAAIRGEKFGAGTVYIGK
jgi:peptidoglycan/xylan/chitin deacetylase (PgdA/CDA1 family)